MGENQSVNKPETEPGASQGWKKQTANGSRTPASSSHRESGDARKNPQLQRSAYQKETAMEQTITLQFTVQEVNIILTGLNELPRKFSGALFDRIDSEAGAQLTTTEEPECDPDGAECLPE